MMHKLFQSALLAILSTGLGLLLIINLLSIWDVIGEEYTEKSMWSILTISICVIVVLIAAKIVEVKRLK